MLPTDRARGSFTYAWVAGPDGQPITFRRCKADAGGRALLADATLREDLGAILPEGARGEMLRRYLAGRPTRLKAERARGVWTIEVTPSGNGFAVTVHHEARKGPAPEREEWPDPRSIPPECTADPPSDPGAVLAALAQGARPDRAMKASTSLARRAGDGVLVLGSDARCRWASPAAATLLAMPAARLAGEGWRRALVGGDRAPFSPGATWTTATRSGRRVEVLVQGHDDEILVVLRDLGALDVEDEEDTVSFVSEEAEVPALPDHDRPSAEIGAPRTATPAGPSRSWSGSAAPVRREKSPATQVGREAPRTFTPPAAPAVVGRAPFDEEVARALDRRRRQGRPAAVACLLHVSDESAGRVRLLAVASGVLRGVDVLGDGDPERVWALWPDTAPAGARRAADRLAEAFGPAALCVGFATLDADDTVQSAMERARRALSEAHKGGRGGYGATRSGAWRKPGSPVAGRPPV